MAYSDFTTLSSARTAFKLSVSEPANLFSDVQGVAPSEYLRITLDENVALANGLNTEKARSELIITPILLEVRRHFNFQVGFFSGTEFNVDFERGLNGYCDYILTARPDIYEIRTPVVAIVEAKAENIRAGLGQCVAEMVAAQIANEREENALEFLTGVVTTGSIWKFLRLSSANLLIDRREYFINEVDEILGILSLPFDAILRT